MSAFAPGTSHMGWKITSRISAGSAPRFNAEKGGQAGVLQVFPFKGTLGPQHQELADRLRRWQEVSHPELVPAEVDLQDRAVVVIRPTLEVLPPTKHEDEKACQVLQVAARALVAFHSHDLAHGELSSASIQIEGARRLLLPPSLDLTPPGVRRLGLDGDPRFAAPEVLDGRPPTPRSDMFSLGLMLYQLLTGAPPVETSDPSDTLAARGAVPAPALQAGGPALKALYAKLTAIQPRRRPAGAEELLADLEGILAKGRSPSPNDLPPGEVHSISLAGPILTLVFLGGLLAALIWYAGGSLAPQSPTEGYVFPPVPARAEQTNPAPAAPGGS